MNVIVCEEVNRWNRPHYSYHIAAIKYISAFETQHSLRFGAKNADFLQKIVKKRQHGSKRKTVKN